MSYTAKFKYKTAGQNCKRCKVFDPPPQALYMYVFKYKTAGAIVRDVRRIEDPPGHIKPYIYVQV